MQVGLVAIRFILGLDRAAIARVATAWLVGAALTGCMNHCVPETRATVTPTPDLMAPVSPPAPVASPRSAPSPPPAIGAVIWAESIDPVTAAPGPSVREYASDAPGLHAVLPAANLQPGDMVRAVWTYNDTPLEALTRTIIIQAPYTAGWIAFSIVRGTDAPWPAGTFAITVSVNDAAVQTATIEVSP